MKKSRTGKVGHRAGVRPSEKKSLVEAGEKVAAKKPQVTLREQSQSARQVEEVVNKILQKNSALRNAWNLDRRDEGPGNKFAQESLALLRKRLLG